MKNRLLYGFILLIISCSSLYAENIYKNIDTLIYLLKKGDVRLYELDESYRKNKKIVLIAVERDGEALQYADKSLRRNLEVVMRAVKTTPHALEYAHEMLHKNRMVTRLIEGREDEEYSVNENTSIVNYGALQYASKEQQADKKFVLSSIIYNPKGFELIANSLKEDKDFLLKALSINNFVFEFFPKRARVDKELILKAMNVGFHYMDESLKKDKEFILEIIKNSPYIVGLEESLQGDKEMILVAVKGDAEAFQYFDEKLKQDRAFVLERLKENGEVLEYINKRFKKDRELVSVAIKQNPYVLDYADETLKHDKEFLLSLIEENYSVGQYIDEVLFEDKEFLQTVIVETGYGLEFATEKQKNDRELILKAIKKRNSYVLEHISIELKKDKELILEAIESYAYPLTYVDKSLKNNRSFIKRAIEKNAYSLCYASGLLQNDRELAVQAINKNSEVLGSLIKKFRKDKDLVRLAVKDSASNFQFADKSLKNSKEFVLEFIRADIDIRPYLSVELKNDEELLELSKEVKRKYESLEVMFTLLALLFFLLFLYSKEKKIYLLSLAIALLGISQIVKIYFAHGVFREPLILVSNGNKYGLEPIKCWLGDEENLSNMECYNVHVPEIHGDEISKTITFPLRVFRSSDIFTSKNPVLHLGGGGPGGSMYLDYSCSIREIANDHDGISTEQGRDLFVIDPRGAGLSKPLLNCETYADNFMDNLRKEPTIDERFKMTERDYAECVNKLKKYKVNFNGYNSIAIADDIEMLREFVEVERWILFGVSYSTTYAMHINRRYPKSVEKMILDSACFPNLKELRHYLLNSMDTFEMFYSYDYNSSKRIDAKKSIWNLYKKLNQNPIEISEKDIRVNGDIFINTLSWGAYGTKIFKELPKILDELDDNNSNSFSPFLSNYLYSMTNKDYGDISSMAHYCYEDKPFIDFKEINKEINNLPKGYIRQFAIKIMGANDFCKEMNITSINKNLNEAIKTDVPTLFIHGEFDSVTPLKDVLEQMKGFSNSKVLTYTKSHSIMDRGDVEDDVARFVAE